MTDEDEIAALKRRVAELESRELQLLGAALYTYLAIIRIPEKVDLDDTNFEIDRRRASEYFEQVLSVKQSVIS